MLTLMKHTEVAMALMRLSLLVFFLCLSHSVSAWMDSDVDGVPDKKDACPNTPLNTLVKANGCHEEYLVQEVPPEAEEPVQSIPEIETQAVSEACLLTSEGMPNNEYCEKVTVSPVYFDFAKSQVLLTQYPLLAKVAELVKQRPAARLTLIGHADIIGAEAFNQSLSVKRAQSVKSVLTSQYGIMPHDISYRGVGNTVPAEGNETVNGRQANRRVEIIIN